MQQKAEEWPVSWSAVWVGALAALAAVVVFGLVGAALGAGSLQGVKDFSTWKTITLFDMSVAVLSAFLAFVIGGWTAAKIAGMRRSEPAILHGAIAWLIALPICVLFLDFGAGKPFGGWYAGVGASAFAGAPTVELSAQAIRNGAIAGVTTVLLGLVGAVIGGWMASGEPMTFGHHRTRDAMRVGNGGGE